MLSKLLRCIALACLCLPVAQLTAQPLLSGFDLDTCYEYTTIEEALAHKDRVVVLNLRRTKLREVPPEITQFPRLQVLNLSKNKIDSVPPFIGHLANLTHLDLSRNKIDSLPPQICQLANLRELAVGENRISHLPDSIHHCSNLELLDMWSNNIAKFPASVAKLPKLREIDLRAIAMSEREQNAIRKVAPQATIHFSQTCNCD